MSFFDDIENLDIITAGEFSTVGYIHSAKILQAPSQISGIFDKRQTPMLDLYGASASTEGRSITFLVQTTEAEYLRQGDQISIDGNNHKIVGVHPVQDGRLTELILKETVYITPTTDDELVNVEIDNIVVGENIAQFRIVYRDFNDDKIYLADSTDVNKVYAIGAVEQNITAEGTGTVRYAGYIKNTSWNFDPSKGLFLGAQGKIVQIPLTNAVAQVDLGTVISSTEILLNISDPIFL